MQSDYDPCLIPLPLSPALTVSSLLEEDSSLFTLPRTVTFDIMSTSIEQQESGSLIRTLEANNYHQWKDLMLAYFLEHNLDGIVEGTEEQPINSPSENQS